MEMHYLNFSKEFCINGEQDWRLNIMWWFTQCSKCDAVLPFVLLVFVKYVFGLWLPLKPNKTITYYDNKLNLEPDF